MHDAAAKKEWQPKRPYTFPKIPNRGAVEEEHNQDNIGAGAGLGVGGGVGTGLQQKAAFWAQNPVKCWLPFPLPQ